MDTIEEKVLSLKQKYRKIFIQVSEEILKQVETLRPKKCECGGLNCSDSVDFFDEFDKDCAYKHWQIEVLDYLENEVSKDVYQKWMQILEYRKEFKCVSCGTCCKLACGEFSQKELTEKSRLGDNFATQFLSVFTPYESKEQAKIIYPEYIKMLDEKMDEGEKVHFYHCPKVKDNRCSDYENRPQICRDFPDNPLSILPKSCGFSKWKEEVEPTSLVLHSTLEIVSFYKNKLKKKD